MSTIGYKLDPELLASRDTGKAKLPGLTPPPTTGNRAMDQWVKQVTERMEVREGSRGNPYERAVTMREFKAIVDTTNKIVEPKPSKDGDIEFDLGNGMTATIAIEKFIKSIKELQVYKDLIKRLDDPSRFDNLPGEVREILLRSIADEAAKLGATITRIEKVQAERFKSLAFRVDQVTAAVDGASAGIRELAFATASADFAQAGKVVQLEASLGNYYQDGTPGRAILEEQMTVTADRIAGLRSQWTMKVQAGKYVAGIGLAATESGSGTGTSALIIAADKFAIVNPSTYTAGLTNTPDPAHIPFGVDTNGIYMNTNVYLRGLMRIDGGGKTLADGLRGSVMVGTTGAWSDNVARQMVWNKLGKGGVPANNNHLVIGDTVTIGTTTKQWNGGAWDVPGVVLNGNMLVDGSISASKVNTTGLIVRDQYGNPILGAGYQLPYSYVTGLGTMATASSAAIGSTVTMGGQVLKVTDFINTLSKINGANISTFIASGAIGSAYIGNAAIQNAHIVNAAIDTLKIQGNAVTVPGAGQGIYEASVFTPNTSGENMPVIIIGIFTQGDGRDKRPWYLHANGHTSGTGETPISGTLGAMSMLGYVPPGGMSLGIKTTYTSGDARCSVVVLGVRR